MRSAALLFARFHIHTWWVAMPLLASNGKELPEVSVIISLHEAGRCGVSPVTRAGQTHCWRSSSRSRSP